MGSIAGKRILVLETDSLTALVVSDMLALSGAIPIGPVVDPSEALKLLVQQPPDVAIIDLDLYRHGAPYEVFERLQAHRIPYVVTSGSAPSPDIPHLKRAPLLLKPYRPKQLEEKLAALIEK